VHSGTAHADPAAGTQAPAALIDLSDGLRSDAGRLARASGAVIDLDGAALDALAEDLLLVAQHVLALEGDAAAADSPDAVRTRARSWVLNGGEDHGFLAAVPEGVNPLGWRRVGRVRPAVDAPSAPVPDARSTAGRSVLIDGVPAEESGFAAVDPDGGYRHFSSTGE
jgi:thiamine-monophosphate kinase